MSGSGTIGSASSGHAAEQYRIIDPSSLPSADILQAAVMPTLAENTGLQFSAPATTDVPSSLPATGAGVLASAPLPIAAGSVPGTGQALTSERTSQWSLVGGQMGSSNLEQSEQLLDQLMAAPCGCNAD